MNILVLYSYYCCIKLSCRYNIPPDLIHLYFNCNIFPSHIILLFIWAHKTSLTLPLVIRGDPGFQVRGAYLKKLRRAEGGAKIFGVFRVKIHDFTPKKQITESPSYP